MTNITLHRIWNHIESVWAASGAWSDYVEVMRLALSAKRTEQQTGEDLLESFVDLPGLGCQAAGGDPSWADDLAAAWFLFYTAAHWMDNVEDRDEPEDWRKDWSPAVAISAATGLYFTASSLLSLLFLPDAQVSAPLEIVRDFHSGFMRMSGGQHRDLIKPEWTLQDYWEIAKAKSGSFFSMACRNGTRLAKGRNGDSADRVEHCAQALGQYGLHLGLLVQILDDLEDYQKKPPSEEVIWKPGMAHSLPVVYALEVTPEPQKAKLLEMIQSAEAGSQSAGQEIVRQIEEVGAVLYVATEIQRHRSLSLAALRDAQPIESAESSCIKLLNRLTPGT